MAVLLLTGPDLPEVELEASQRQIFRQVRRWTYLELLALKDVAVRTTRLAWPTRNGSVQTASSELTLEKSVDLGLYKSGIRGLHFT